MKRFLIVLALLCSCASEPEKRDVDAHQDTEALFQKDLDMVCSTPAASASDAQDYIVRWKESARTEKMKNLIGEDRESVTWLRDRLEAERGTDCSLLAHWESIFSGGTLDSNSVSKVLRAASKRIQKCYERVVKERIPAPHRKVVVSFVIARDGTVASSEPATDEVLNLEVPDDYDDGVGECVAGIIATLQFPKPAGGEVTVNKTFIFETSE